MLLLFRAPLPKPKHSFSFPSARDFPANRSQMSAWGWQAGVGPKGDRAHFPGVTGSTAPWQHGTAQKADSVWHGKGSVLLQRLAREEGNAKRDGEHVGSSNSYSTAQSMVRAAEATKPCSKSYIYSLILIPSCFPFWGRFLVKCPPRQQCGKAALFPPLLKQQMYPMLITCHF